MSTWAFLVGINAYRHLTRLEYAVPDVEALGDSLVSNLGLAPERIIRMTCQMKGENHADAAGIEDRLMWLARRLEPDDTLVFAFSGHGFLLPDGSAFLAAVDTRHSADPYVLRRSSVSLEVVQRRLQQAGAAQTFVILDCCRDDPAPGKGLGGGRLAAGMVEAVETFTRNIVVRPTHRGRRNRAFATLFACSPGEKACEWKDRGHGVFWAYLLEALSGPGAEADGRFTAHSLAQYVCDRVPPKVDELHHRPQRPQFCQAEGAPIMDLGPPRSKASVGASCTLPPPPTRADRRGAPSRTGWATIAGASCVLALAVTIIYLRNWRASPSMPPTEPVAREWTDRSTPHHEPSPKLGPPGGPIDRYVSTDTPSLKLESAIPASAPSSAVCEAVDEALRGIVIEQVPYRAIINAPALQGRTKTVLRNVDTVWQRLHGTFQGQEVPELCRIVGRADRDWGDRWRALALLGHAVATPVGRDRVVEILDAVSPHLEERYSNIQMAALDIIRNAEAPSAEKWRRLHRALDNCLRSRLADPPVAKLISPLVKFTPPEKKAMSFAVIADAIDGCKLFTDLAHPLKELNYRDGIPRMREMLVIAPNHEAADLADVLAEWKDKSSSPLIHTRIEESKTRDIYLPGLLRSYLKLEGNAGIDYVCRKLATTRSRVQVSFLTRITTDPGIEVHDLLTLAEKLAAEADDQAVTEAAQSLLTRYRRRLEGPVSP